MTDATTGSILVIIGLLVMIGTAQNWRIVSHPGKILNIIFGDKVARVIYMITGIILFILGLGQLFGMNWMD